MLEEPSVEKNFLSCAVIKYFTILKDPLLLGCIINIFFIDYVVYNAPFHVSTADTNANANAKAKLI